MSSVLPGKTWALAALFVSSTWSVQGQEATCPGGTCARPEAEEEADLMRTSLLQTRSLKSQVEAKSASAAEDLAARKAALLQELDSVESRLAQSEADGVSEGVRARATSLKTRNLLEGTSGCHDITEDDVDSLCWKSINWARNDGKAIHPEWYPNLYNTTPIAQWQAFVFKNSHGQCPAPCNWHGTDGLCNEVPAPKLWAPRLPKESFEVKILSYNLFWWNLFRQHKTRNNMAAHLIEKTNSPPYDVMGFQECESKHTLMHPLGLDKEFTSFDANHAICQSFRKDAWDLLKHGETDVAEDQLTEYYGTRGTVWMRIKHKGTGATLFFVNHHGPLSVNSGGLCGGESVAHNILHLIKKEASEGDIIVVVGDFNANGASKTIQTLWKNLVLAYNGVSFGGVDNVFTNVPKSWVVETKDIGSGGSDHHAVSVTLEIKAAAEAALLAKEAEEQGEDGVEEPALIQEEEGHEVAPISLTDNELFDKLIENASGSCQSYGCTGHYVASQACQCTGSCKKYNNCCFDYDVTCNGKNKAHSCRSYGCSTKWNIGNSCQCTASCKKQNDCCWDYHATCETQQGQQPTAPKPEPREEDAKGSCKKYGCQNTYNPSHKCQCSQSCHKHNNCCHDYYAKCARKNRGPVTKEPMQSVRDSAKSECGVHETNIQYIYEGGWHTNIDRVASPRDCCRKCDQHHGCRTWVWYDWVDEIKDPRCTLQGGNPTSKVKKEGIVSGMPIHIAQQVAWKESKHAISEMPAL